jgi:hypothetical protein
LEDLFEDLEGQGSAGDGLFVQHIGAFGLGVAEGRLKGRLGMARRGRNRAWQVPFGHYDSLRARKNRCREGADFGEVLWN